MVAFRTFREHEWDLSSIMELILQESSDHIKTKELKWDKKIVQHERKHKSAFVRDMLEFEFYEDQADL